MKFLADESVDGPIVYALREEGLSVEYVAEDVPGIPDNEVLSRANQSDAILLTEDKDFGELVFRLHKVSSGVLLIRLAGLMPNTKAKIVVSVVKKHLNELQASFTVISPVGVRIRRKNVN